LFFFFQAEDGIRDFHVTGVQTCALPISPIRLALDIRNLRLTRCCCFPPPRRRPRQERNTSKREGGDGDNESGYRRNTKGYRRNRSEERRVGKECRSRWEQKHEKKTNAKE